MDHRRKIGAALPRLNNENDNEYDNDNEFGYEDEDAEQYRD
jgi:hypothetical protein